MNKSTLRNSTNSAPKPRSSSNNFGRDSGRDPLGDEEWDIDFDNIDCDMDLDLDAEIDAMQIDGTWDDNDDINIKPLKTKKPPTKPDVDTKKNVSSVVVNQSKNLTSNTSKYSNNDSNRTKSTMSSTSNNTKTNSSVLTGKGTVASTSAGWGDEDDIDIDDDDDEQSNNNHNQRNTPKPDNRNHGSNPTASAARSVTSVTSSMGKDTLNKAKPNPIPTKSAANSTNATGVSKKPAPVAKLPIDDADDFFDSPPAAPPAPASRPTAKVAAPEKPAATVPMPTTAQKSNDITDGSIGSDKKKAKKPVAKKLGVESGERWEDF